jgi:hypothetical protein
VRVFKNTWFTRFARKENISDEELRKIVKRLEAGQPDVDYGGDVYKMRVARPGEGKSGGYRVIVFFRSEDKTFCHYAYPKSHQGNISEKELKILKRQAKKHFAQSDEQIRRQLINGTLLEIT